MKPTTGEDMILLVSQEGKAIQFKETDARAMGRSAAGVRGIRLKESDRLVTTNIVHKDVHFVSITHCETRPVFRIPFSGIRTVCPC